MVTCSRNASFDSALFYFLGSPISPAPSLEMMIGKKICPCIYSKHKHPHNFWSCSALGPYAKKEEKRLKKYGYIIMAFRMYLEDECF